MSAIAFVQPMVNHAPHAIENRRVLEHVLVPLRVRALHGQEVELVPFQNEPDRDGDCASGLSPDHADLDLAVSGKAFFEAILWSSHAAPLRDMFHKN